MGILLFDRRLETGVEGFFHQANNKNKARAADKWLISKDIHVLEGSSQSNVQLRICGKDKKNVHTFTKVELFCK